MFRLRFHGHLQCHRFQHLQHHDLPGTALAAAVPDQGHHQDRLLGPQSHHCHSDDHRHSPVWHPSELSLRPGQDRWLPEPDQLYPVSDHRLRHGDAPQQARNLRYRGGGLRVLPG